MYSRIALVAVCVLPLLALPAPKERGALVIVGGGGTPDEVLIEALALTGEQSPRVVVIPQASSLEDRGQSSVTMWRDQGVEHVDLLDPLDRPDTMELLEAADLIWFSGGSQLDLMIALAQAKLTGPLSNLHTRGCVFGGTSAGAAIMGPIMISGAPDPAPLIQGAMRPHRGLGLWPAAIVDQHFLSRNREGRLLTATLAGRRMIGVGVAERTAVIVQGDTLRVTGEGQALFYDTRTAEVPPTKEGAQQSARNISLHVLAPGDDWTWFQ